jgi:hypothetical protein
MIAPSNSGATDTNLRHLADSYLEVLLGRDLARVSLAPDFRVSVNAAWIAPTALPAIDDFPALQMFTDPEQGCAALVGVAILAGVRRPFALRLGAENGRIGEAEIILSNSCKGHFADVDQLMYPDVLYDAPVPPARSSGPKALEAAANGYWTGLQESDGAIPKFSYRCDRFDNGKKITNNLSILLSPEATVLTCTSSLYATRTARPVCRNRRFPLLDINLGVAVSFVMVDFQPNPYINLPGMTHYMMGLFKVVDGEIRSLDELTEKLPFGTASIW